MAPSEISTRVGDALAQIENEQDVQVLFACESGSRAWGFASLDSDYDVRFIYVHRRDWYLSIDQGRDVIERPIAEDLDVSGWDLRKALRLLKKSNPPLLEWLKSPIVYQCETKFVDQFADLAHQFYSPRRCFAHYLHMARGNARDYLIGREVVSLKNISTSSAPFSPAAGLNGDTAKCRCDLTSFWRVSWKKLKCGPP